MLAVCHIVVGWMIQRPVSVAWQTWDCPGQIRQRLGTDLMRLIWCVDLKVADDFMSQLASIHLPRGHFIAIPLRGQLYCIAACLRIAKGQEEKWFINLAHISICCYTVKRRCAAGQSSARQIMGPMWVAGSSWQVESNHLLVPAIWAVLLCI